MLSVLSQNAVFGMLGRVFSGANQHPEHRHNAAERDCAGQRNDDHVTPGRPGQVIVRVDPRYYRPTEVETLLGDPTKARQKLGWTPTTKLDELVAEMIDADFTAAKRDALVRSAGFQAYDYHE